MYSESHLGLVHAAIDGYLGGGEVGQDVKRFATRSPNLAKATTDAIAVAYRSGCRRELKGANEATGRAFADIVAEAGIDRKAAGLNARSWFAGPHIVTPCLSKRGRLVLDLIGPDSCEVQREGDDIDAVIWQRGGTYIELDAQRYAYYDDRGKENAVSIRHAVGVCPAAAFVSFDGGPDWWASTAHAGLTDATLLCAYKQALGLYFRQVNGAPLTVIFADLQNSPPGQVLGHPVQPLLLPLEARVQVDATRIVPAKDYLEEIGAIITMAISAEGLPPGSVTLTANNSDWGNLAISAEGPRLAAHRDKQVPHLRASELALWPMVVDFIRGTAHRHARTLPPGDELRDMLRVSFPDLSSPAEQLARIEVMKAGLPFGISSPVDVPLSAKPELTRSEAEETARENLAYYIATIEPLVSRNIPKEPPTAEGHQTIAQQQGRAGGKASGEARQENP